MGISEPASPSVGEQCAVLYAIKSGFVPSWAGPGSGSTGGEVLTAQDQPNSTGLRLCQTDLPTLKI